MIVTLFHALSLFERELGRPAPHMPDEELARGAERAGNLLVDLARQLAEDCDRLVVVADVHASFRREIAKDHREAHREIRPVERGVYRGAIERCRAHGVVVEPQAWPQWSPVLGLGPTTGLGLEGQRPAARDVIASIAAGWSPERGVLRIVSERASLLACAGPGIELRQEHRLDGERWTWRAWHEHEIRAEHGDPRLLGEIAALASLDKLGKGTARALIEGGTLRGKLVAPRRSALVVVQESAACAPGAGLAGTTVPQMASLRAAAEHGGAGILRALAVHALRTDAPVPWELVTGEAWEPPAAELRAPVGAEERGDGHDVQGTEGREREAVRGELPPAAGVDDGRMADVHDGGAWGAGRQAEAGAARGAGVAAGDRGRDRGRGDLPGPVGGEPGDPARPRDRVEVQPDEREGGLDGDAAAPVADDAPEERSGDPRAGAELPPEDPPFCPQREALTSERGPGMFPVSPLSVECPRCGQRAGLRCNEVESVVLTDRHMQAWAEMREQAAGIHVAAARAAAAWCAKCGHELAPGDAIRVRGQDVCAACAIGEARDRDTKTETMKETETMPPTDATTETEIETRYEEPRTAAPLAVRREEPAVAPMSPSRQLPPQSVAMRPEAPPAPPQPGPRTSDTTGQLFAALAAAQMEFSDVVKTRTADVRSARGAYSYKYANLADVSAAITPALKRHGLVPMQIPMGNRIYVRIVHGASGEWIEGGLPLALPDYGSDIQRLGSALTYMRRYLLTMMLGIVAEDEDDDGAAAMPQPGAAA